MAGLLRAPEPPRSLSLVLVMKKTQSSVKPWVLEFTNFMSP